MGYDRYVIKCKAKNRTMGHKDISNHMSIVQEDILKLGINIHANEMELTFTWCHE